MNKHINIPVKVNANETVLLLTDSFVVIEDDDGNIYRKIFTINDNLFKTTMEYNNYEIIINKYGR